MDISHVIFEPMIKYWYFIVLLFIVPFLTLFFKSSWYKGKSGERQVNQFLARVLDDTQYHLIKDVTLPTKNGTTQIDHIIVSPFGIFVIETKNMDGWIFGNERQAQWTQKIYKKTYQFQNPLRQNYKHIKTLESSLAINPDNIFSVVVFVGDSTFKTEMPENVGSIETCINYIKRQNSIVLDGLEVIQITKKIDENRLERGLKTDRAHIAHLDEKNATPDKYIHPVIDKQPSAMVCPKCAHAMVLRVAKRGANQGNTFYGCSQYPKCRAIVQA